SQRVSITQPRLARNVGFPSLLSTNPEKFGRRGSVALPVDLIWWAKLPLCLITINGRQRSGRPLCVHS
ncbi:MAG TPA: hypothetical protein VK327_15925, partial [Candidatus Paceibacterota bacterium]|nr:hypothetical protein [Candidatus Paceibacterota bacterium]